MTDVGGAIYMNSDLYNSRELSSQPHSRQSSLSSGSPWRSNSSTGGDNSVSSGNSGGTELVLTEGRELLEESATEPVYVNSHNSTTTSRSTQDFTSSHSTLGGTAKAKAAKSPFSAAGSTSQIPEEEFSIPPDGNISSFSADQLAGFLQCLRVDDRIIAHLHRKQVDGKRFSKLKDSELESLHLQNPVVLFFRGRSEVKKSRSKGQWRL